MEIVLRGCAQHQRPLGLETLVMLELSRMLTKLAVSTLNTGLAAVCLSLAAPN